MKYELLRCRFRCGEHSNDVGPEGGYFRYEISLGYFDSIKECEDKIERCEGIPASIIVNIEGVLYQTKMKSTGHPITDPMRRPGYTDKNGKYMGVIKHDSYWDEYVIEKIEAE